MEQKQHGKRTTEESADSSKGSDDEFFCCAMRHLKQVKKQVDNALIENDPDQGVADQGGKSDCEDWTQRVFRNAETPSGPLEISTRKEQSAES